MRRVGKRLTELPSNLALAAAALCNLFMIVLLDMKKTSLAGNMRGGRLVLLLVLISGVCYGISFGTIKKYQKHSDALFGYDKYAYLCSALGAVSGAILGAVMMDALGDTSVRVLSLVFSAVTCVLSIWLLEDLEIAPQGSNTVDKKTPYFIGAVLAAFPAAAAVGYVWVYLTGYLGTEGYGAASASFCAVMPVIAFCFGNRLRLRTRGTRCAALVTEIVIACAAFIPMLAERSPAMAALSALIAAFAVLFGSAAIYSIMGKSERVRFAAVFLALLVLTMLISAALLDVTLVRGTVAAPLYYSIAAAVTGFAFLFTKFPVGENGQAAAISTPTKLNFGFVKSIFNKKEEASKKEKPVKEKPIKEKPIKEKPVKEKPVKEKKEKSAGGLMAGILAKKEQAEKAAPAEQSNSAQNNQDNTETAPKANAEDKAKREKKDIPFKDIFEKKEKPAKPEKKEKAEKPAKPEKKGKAEKPTKPEKKEKVKEPVLPVFEAEKEPESREEINSSVIAAEPVRTEEKKYNIMDEYATTSSEYGDYAEWDGGSGSSGTGSALLFDEPEDEPPVILQ